MESNRVTRQSKSDDSNHQKTKGQSNPRTKLTGNSQSSTNQKKVKENSVERHDRPKRSQNNLHENPNDQTKMKKQFDNMQLQSGVNDNTPIMDSAGALTENSAIYSGGPAAGPTSLGVNQVHTGSQDAVLGLDRNSTNQMETANNWTPGTQGNGKANPANQHYANKSDTNLGGPTRVNATTGLNRINISNAEAKKKRKNSDKASRKASNNKKVDRDGMGIPPIDQNQGSANHPRSHSRGAAVSSQSQGNNTQNYSKDQNQTNPTMNQQYFEQFNPFMQNSQNNSAGFPMSMNGVNAGNNGFPFNNQGTGPFMGGNNQAPQVHFIAKKQQFIAQISPEQLMGSDKRPYTAQSLNNLSANAKRAGNVYANGMANTTKSNGAHGNHYNIANAAFSNYPAVYLGGGSRTHTQGFGGFHPHGNHKFSKSIYGEDVKPKIAGKDILHAMGASNGFSSGYNSDPYSSVMSQGLPQSLTNSTRPAKQKPNRLQAKEKEQLYDETIKMKVLNNQLKEDHVKLKTKIKILENELNRKEKTIEDLFGQNQIIQQSNQKTQSSNNQGLLPLAHTASKYQQETFLVMSLKKQIRELKYEATKKDEELEILRKNIKNTRTKELEQEILAYHEECLRLRQMMEDVIKQGPSHPIHIQGYVDRANQMQAELNQKDMVIGQLTDSLNNLQNQTTQTMFPANLSAIKSPDATKFDITAQDVQMANQDALGQQNQLGLRDKSVERKPITQASGQVKDVHKDLQRARKQLREKEKEMVKLRAEVNAQKRENQEKARNDSQQNKDSEQYLKTLKDKLRESKNDNKRKEDKLLEGSQKAVRLEEQLKALTEQLKAFEESNKTLKNQMRSLKQQKSAKQNEVTKQESAKAPEKGKDEGKKSESPAKQLDVKEEFTKSTKQKPKVEVPKKELALMTLIGQREKLSRDDLTTMMLAGEESLKMLIRQPTEGLIDFIKSNLDDEDALLAGIPRFEMPKTEFENQVLREMRIVLRENADLINEYSKEEMLNWKEFEIFYNDTLKFDYPHKDKLLEFLKYFFLDHIVSVDVLMMNFAAFKDHLFARRRITPDKRDSSLRSRRRSDDSSGRGDDDPLRRRLGAGPDDEKHHEEERMLDIAEQCFMRIADLLHMHQRTVKQAFLKYAQPEQFKDGSVLELISPRSFLEGVKDIGFDDVTELEAACLMKVLAKPELENSVILNEFVLIMENFGIPTLSDEEEYENDYIPDTDDEREKEEAAAKEEGKDEDKEGKKDDEKKDKDTSPMDDPEKTEDDKKDETANDKEDKKDPLTEKHAKMKDLKTKTDKKLKNQIIIKFDILDEKGSKILKKLARFLLQRYMHPREFFGPTIKKDTFGKKNCKVEIIKHHDFYLRLKLASIRKKLKENVTINQFLAIDGDKFPGFIQVKRMIKALEIIAEGEQELMVKEQEEKQKEFKQKCDEFAKDREEKGLPPMTEEEIEAELRKDEKDPEEKDPAKKSDDFSGKPPAGPSKPSTEEFMRIGSKNSPKGKDKEGAGKNRFASHLGPSAQLNTIEEDLHETQTSHYSYQVKDGEGSERDGSKHQLSTSNHLRGSHPLNELEDSSRRSVNSDARAKAQALGASVGSGDYSGGSNSSVKKGTHKDIDSSEINVNDFKKAGTATEKVSKEKRHQLEVENQARPDDFNEHRIAIMETNEPASARKAIPEENEADIDDADFDAKMKDELDEEVNKKYHKQLQSSVHGDKLDEEGDEEGYSDEEMYEDRNASGMDNLKEDTINTQKIEQLVEEDMKDHEHDYIGDQMEGPERHSDKDRASVDELDMEGTQDYDVAEATVPRRNSTPDKPYEDDIEEYSYHDEGSLSHQEADQILKQNAAEKGEQAARKDQESDIEEDYEF